MQGKISIRLAILAALAALVAVIVPAGLASGDSTPIVSEAGVIYLSMGNGPNGDVITYDGLADQPIPTKKNDCTEIDKLSVDGAGSILVVDQLNSVKLGESKDHIGALGPNDGSGEPCALAAAGAGVNGANEGISVSLGQAADGVLMKGFSIDVRLKGTDATVEATFWLDGTEIVMENPEDFAFTQAADSGPDSADNYRWTVDLETTYFDEVQFEATEGAFALGGGVESDVPGAFDDSSHASQFLTVREYNGQLECDPDYANIGTAGSDLTYGTVVMRSEDLGGGWIVDNCVKKPYLADNTDDALSFVPFDPEGYSGTSARYTLEVTVEEQLITTDASGRITSLIAEYDPAGSLEFPAGTTVPLQSCRFVPPTDSGLGGYDAFWTQASPVDNGAGLNLLPSGESACFFGAEVSPTGTNSSGATIGTEHWLIYFEDDPSVRFK